MKFRSEDIDQPQMFQAWQIFIEQQRNEMFQEFQKISDNKEKENVQNLRLGNVNFRMRFATLLLKTSS